VILWNRQKLGGVSLVWQDNGVQESGLVYGHMQK
jgi:hypothetical protein